MRTLIITNCCSKKNHILNDNQILHYDDFVNEDTRREKENKEPLKSNQQKAYDMYVGHQYGYTEPLEKRGPLKSAIAKLREKYGKESLDVYIISAAYGLISENDLIFPYDLYFDNICNISNGCFTVKSWSEHLGIQSQLRKICNNYDLIVFITAGNYTKSANLVGLSIRDNQKCIVFDKPKSCKKNNNILFVPPVGNYKNIDTTKFPTIRYKLRASMFHDMITYAIESNLDPFAFLYDFKGDFEFE